MNSETKTSRSQGLGELESPIHDLKNMAQLAMNQAQKLADESNEFGSKIPTSVQHAVDLAYFCALEVEKRATELRVKYHESLGG